MSGSVCRKTKEAENETLFVYKIEIHLELLYYTYKRLSIIVMVFRQKGEIDYE